ncbi:hypothetical protein AAFC00_004547 [Neodothiora populina]|uniref:FAD dependent oxidoreductase domain-containing protein n=1 Tax=Neodothiora populina TaxID=2781224 RepID=A0ABR3P2D1_9PEZI
MSTEKFTQQSGFPKQNGQSISYWLRGVQGDALLNHRTTPELPVSTDIVVIGSGLTGTLVAKECLATWPEKRIVVLEAREFCSGATGRNAGHCKPDQYRGFEAYEKAFGNEQALKILANEWQTWSDMVQYVRENDVDCNLWVGDTLDVPMTPEVAARTANQFERVRAAGGKVDHIKVTTEPSEAAKISRIDGAQACYAWSASTLYPWKLAAHIMRENLKNGVNLQTRTVAAFVKPSSENPGKWMVQTDRGEIECGQVIHATNAYSPALEPSLRDLIRPSPHICNKIVPPVSFAGSNGLQNSYGVLLPDGALFSINPNCASGGDLILFGGSNPGQRKFENWLSEHPQKYADDGLTSFETISDAIKEFTESHLPGWTAEHSGIAYDDGWSGIIAWSADTVPFVGQLPNLPGQWICAGHHGHGMARIFTAAPGLVKLMAGKSWTDTELPVVWEITSERVVRLKEKKPLNVLTALSGKTEPVEAAPILETLSHERSGPRL